MFASARQPSTTAGGADTRTPSASKTSALPDRLDTDRLPCFATRTPHAATTIAAQEEMLNVPERSPPVPHVSNTPSYRADSAHRVRAHRTGEADELDRTLAFHRETDKQAGNLRGGGAACHDLGHGGGGLLARQILVPRQFFQHLRKHPRQSIDPLRKFRSRWWPSPVKMDSGWNWTP